MAEIKTGYHIRKSNQPNDNLSKPLQRKYPSGVLPFSIKIIIFIIIMVFGILYGDKTLGWYDVWVISSVVICCFDALWWLGRCKFVDRTRFQMHQLSRTFKISNVINKIENKRDLTEKNFDSMKDFDEYMSERTKNTSWFFYVSLITSALSFVSSLITMLIYRL